MLYLSASLLPVIHGNNEEGKQKPLVFFLKYMFFKLPTLSFNLFFKLKKKNRNPKVLPKYIIVVLTFSHRFETFKSHF